MPANRTEHIGAAGKTDARDAYVAPFAQVEREQGERGGAWLRALRKEAFARFTRLGFPTTQDEAWKFTNVSAIAKRPFPLAARVAAGALGREPLSALPFAASAETRLVFVNAHVVPELSAVAGLPSGVRVESLAAALDARAADIEPHLGRHAAHAKHALVALNTALFADGAFVHVPKGTVVAEPIVIVYLSTAPAEATISSPRTLVVVEDRGQATIVECYARLGRDAHDVYLTNAVTEIVAGQDTIVDHYRIQRESTSAFHTSATHVDLGRASNFRSHSISLGGGLVRNDVVGVLGGEGIECTLNGLYLVGDAQHVDNHTTIDHAKPHCASHELYKGILTGSSRAVFNGKILVRPDAQKTDAKQTNKNLLLSEDAMINTKPQLEIYADDVKCTHGATIGRLDESQIFYLRSRGVPHAEAAQILTYAFGADVIQRVKPAAVRAGLEAALLEHLPGGGPAESAV